MSIEFNYSSNSDFGKAFVDATKKFPASTEKALKKEVNDLKKQITAGYVGDLIKSKRKNVKIVLKNKKKDRIEKSFYTGKVIKQGNNYTNAVLTRAPHYHLVEDGHEAGGWYEQRYPDAHYVAGKKIVARIMERRSRSADEIGERVLNEILRDVGL